MLRALVIDDEFGIRHIIKLALSRMDIEIFEAETAEAARQILDAVAPHLVLMDLRLPDMHGVDLALKIREGHPALPIVFMSASTELARDAEKAGVTAYLEKPFKLAQLHDLVRSIVGVADAAETTP